MTSLRIILSRTIAASVLLWAFAGIASLAAAENLESDSFIIQFGNFNVTSGEKSSEGFTLTDTVGQVGAGPYGEYGTSSFFLGSGFQYIYQLTEFSFSISKLLIDFGTMAPDAHATDSHTLTITTNGAGGYVVYAYEAHPLRHRQNPSVEIEDTECDSGCTTTSAGIWTNQSNPGFGYNLTGSDIPSDFIDISFFRPFPDFESTGLMEAVMSSPNVVRDSEATVTYKAGITGNQDAGHYETNVVYVAVPGY